MSLDGGGVRGIVQAYILNKIQIETKKPLWAIFDLIVGTSTGGLIALLIGIGLSGNEIVEFYLNKSKTIFEENRFSFGGKIKPKFSSAGLQKLADELFGNTLFSNLRTNVVCPAYCLEFGRPILYRSFDKTGSLVSCADLAVSISSAPTYFKPKKIKNLSFIDGGVFLNNPATEAAATAFELYKNDFQILSIGNGIVPVCVHDSDKKNTGELFWIGKIIDIVFDGVSDLADDQCHRILGDKFLRINSQLPGSINPDLADCSSENVHKLIALADEIWLSRKREILGCFY